MKKIFLISCVLVSFQLIAQTNDLILPAGTQKVLTEAERNLTLGKFQLGDNVTIVIPGNMNGWTVNAGDVTIGHNVKIIGPVTSTYGGLSGAQPAKSPNCRAGATGGNGASGQTGASGKNISLNLRIRSIGSLTIQVYGGIGGNGGNGGIGGSGGNATCTCNAGAGGTGGSGGNGGNGGIGGVVSIVYSKIGHVIVDNSSFIIQNSGGVGGMGGAGAVGGQGGLGGGCSDAKAVARPSGATGTNGARGNEGVAGRNGSITISAQ